ncbi:MAG TPA: Fe-S cluster assembly protein HesB [Chloroflexota bacterium]
MPKLERLEWIAPLSDGLGITLSDDPEADRLLEQDANALLLGVLYDSQFSTRRAFSAPLRLSQRLGHLDLALISAMDAEDFAEVFRQKPALHRFPGKFAKLTQQLALFIVERYGGESRRIWSEAVDVPDLSRRILALPAFGVEKTNWTVGMLGRLGELPYGGWEEFRLP